MARNEQTVIIVQGEYHVSCTPGVVISTLLGSCVAACLHDPVAQLGGMNHFLLPGQDSQDRTALKYGLHAMELLINALIRAGAQRGRLQAKLFGGAHLVHGFPDIGQANATFASDFLRREGIAHLGGSLGGTQARKLRYAPATGRAQQYLLPDWQESAPALAPTWGSEILLFTN